MKDNVSFSGVDIKYQGVDIAAWITRIGSDNGRLQKERVLEEALTATILGSTDAEAFLATCYLAYNPFFTFNIRQVPETVGINGRDNPWPEFWKLCDDLRLREVTGNAAREAVEDMSEQFDSDQWNLVARPTLLKDLRVGISEKTINKVVGKTAWRIPVFSCQLAQDSEGAAPKMRGKKRLEKKLDGNRMLVIFDDNGACLGTFSRNGKEFTNFGHIQRALEAVVKSIGGVWWNNGMVFDGEVMSDSFQNLMKQARRKTEVDTADTVYHIFDMIPLTDFKKGYCFTPQYQRTAWLEERRDKFAAYPCLHITEGTVVDLDSAEGNAAMKQYANEAVEQGYEGIMIKNQNEGYHCKRSSSWLKWKPVHDYDLQVVAVEEGTGKNVGRLGALVCEGVDQGKHIRVNVGSGFSDELRDEIWRDRDSAIGQTVVVLCDAITQNASGEYSLRFPRFKTFRTDKD